jgi:hypothetical protein
MGLRCLLGHEYANREVEREREERGDEVVVTYRTVETCERCGERRIVSENKEVRSVRPPEDEAVTTGLGEDGVTPDLGGGAAAVDDDGEGGPATAAVDDGGERTPEPEEPTVDPEEETEADPDDGVDDAIILDDDGSDAGRGHGEWLESADDTATADDEEVVPDAADDGTTVVTGEGWPEPDGEDEGFDATPSDDTESDVAFGGGLTPEEAAGGDATNGEAVAAEGGVAGKQFVAAASVEPVGGNRSDGETEFFCPNCSHARTAGGSSMRAGDICPECHQGYIAERER